MSNPPIQPQRNRQDLWEEYRVIEARLHNDSKINYAIVGSFLAGAFILFSAFVSTLISAAESDQTSLTKWALPITTGLFAVLLVYFGKRVFVRFNETGEIRRARAIHLERLLQIASFRLFPPWVEMDPEDYLALGESFSHASWNGGPQSRQSFEVRGIQEYWRIQSSAKVGDLIGSFTWAATIVLMLLVGIVVGIAIAG